MKELTQYIGESKENSILAVFEFNYNSHNCIFNELGKLIVELYPGEYKIFNQVILGQNIERLILTEEGIKRIKRINLFDPKYHDYTAHQLRDKKEYAALYNTFDEQQSYYNELNKQLKYMLEILEKNKNNI